MYLAIDIGGTKTLLACFTPDGALTKTHKFLTPADYPDFIEMLGQELSGFATEEYIAAGIAVPGRLDRTTGIGIAFGNRPWENVPIRADIQHFISCPLVLENDTKLAGLSEALLIVNDYKKVLYVTISTGISSALIVNGVIDADTADSETGQLLLEHEGRLTDWEDFASGRAFQEKFGKRVGEIGDEPQAWYYIARNIAVGLVNLIAAYTPQVIVLGGGVGAHLEKFQDRLTEQLRIYQNPLFSTPPLLKAQRAEEAVIYGCYTIAKDVRGQVTHSS